ncbi:MULTISPECIES: magnesium transporter [Stappiaceae]|jgi:magnesium transporter|uniref:Magnesium transporter MgtE n=3 Tax=Roseibium TaxID=150830 RepID=A0A0M6XXM9_9HYPH|nr:MULTISPECIES: magnesium transporter [Stappiaceae]MCR9282783.1 magnesium transporter [Paracoccaceae bacterium]AQQ06426.1 magnesium transporter [Roseibium aggregatum]MBN8182657.1 magnesium transporter [Roseibium aggregatum]MBO6857769.1 magnesium transporter [Roseibium sp.]MBO9462998.1 magnesium transporter [Labrenzia sp. R5_0]
MSEASELDVTASPVPDIPVRDEDEHLNREFIAAVEAAIEANDQDGLRHLAADLHEADTGDLLETLDPEDRASFIRLLGEDFDYTALTEIDEAVRLQVLEDLPTEVIAEGLGELDSDDAVYILEDLDEDDQAAILEELPYADRAQLQKALDYPEESAGRRMQTEFIAVAPFWTIGQTIDYMREARDLPDSFYEIYVVDPTFKLLGSVHLDKILRTKRDEKVTSIMEETRQAVLATEDQEEVARRFERYNLVSSAVVDENDRLVGVLTVDDIVDVIQEEAEEDLRALAGVGDEEISDNVMTIARSRLTWLVVNLGTAVLASVVIALFEDTIEAMVALAVLMPIVASMGGNAGTQTMTVAVRGIATQELGARNLLRVLNREILVSVFNGVALAILIGVTAWMWFGSPGLGVVIGGAIVINLLFAGLSGLLIPIALDKMNVDPAIASSVFVTTVTDVVGFFAFLGIAALWFGLPF